MRTHFHRFMRRVHAELTQLKGQKTLWNKWLIVWLKKPVLFVLMSFRNGYYRCHAAVWIALSPV